MKRGFIDDWAERTDADGGEPFRTTEASAFSASDGSVQSPRPSTDAALPSAEHAAHIDAERARIGERVLDIASRLERLGSSLVTPRSAEVPGFDEAQAMRQLMISLSLLIRRPNTASH